VRAVGIKVLKNRLSEYVRLASAGEIVLVTDRDEVVAELGPPRVARSAVLDDARLAEAVRNGWLTPPTLGRLGDVPHAPVAPLADLLEELERDRSDR
jgi:antitoxin (DNA-binding transcriptional repressor) of toxin-antitoxin stability system